MLAIAPFDPSARPVVRHPVVRWQQLPDPEPKPDEVLVRVRATALNHADLLQMRGLYPPPPGESEVPGLEASGDVVAIGSATSRFKIGDRVAALLAGGGHGEQVAVPEGQAFPLWAGASYAEGAALAEAALTSWVNLVVEGRLQSGQMVVITGANGGIGSFAVQLARALGGRSVAIVRRAAERSAALQVLGATEVLEADSDWPRRVKQMTQGAGADLALEFLGGASTAKSLECLRIGGRCVLLGVLTGGRAELDLADLLRRRLRLTGSTLRARSRVEKAELVRAFYAFSRPLLERGKLRAVIDRTVRFADLPAAYALLEEGVGLGKIVAVTD